MTNEVRRIAFDMTSETRSIVFQCEHFILLALARSIYIRLLEGRWIRLRIQ